MGPAGVLALAQSSVCKQQVPDVFQHLRLLKQTGELLTSWAFFV